MLLEKIGHRRGFVKLSLIQRSSTVQIFSMNIGAACDQQFGDSSLIAMCRGVQWRSSPVLIIVSGIYVRTVIEQRLNNFQMAFPGSAMKWSRAVGIASVDQGRVLLKEFADS